MVHELLRSLTGRRPALDRYAHQGHYGESFVHALAAAAGLQLSKPYPDVDGVDWMIGRPGGRGFKSPWIEVQVKSWSVPQGSREHWRYRELTEQQFNKLAGEFQLHRYLFLVVVPDVADNYTEAGCQALRLHHAAYWASFRSSPPVDNPSSRKKKPVRIPKANLLTVTSLRGLMETAQAEE